MSGKVLGIPLVFILLVAFLSLAVDVPMAILHKTTQEELRKLQTGQQLLYQKMDLLMVTPTVTPTASPTATMTPKKSVKSSSTSGTSR